MPRFDTTYSHEDIAAIASYVRQERDNEADPSGNRTCLSGLAQIAVSPYSRDVMKTSVRNTTGMHSIMDTSMMTTIIETIICWPAEPGVC